MATLTRNEKNKLETAFQTYVKANRLPMNTQANRNAARRKWVESIKRNNGRDSSSVGAIDASVYTDMLEAVLDYAISSRGVASDVSAAIGHTATEIADMGMKVTETVAETVVDSVKDFATGAIEIGSSFSTGGEF